MLANRSMPAATVIPVLALRGAAYTAENLGGHVWTFSESIADVAPEAWGGVSGPGL